jgi:hypothetical protein
MVVSPAAMLKANCGWLRPCTLGDFSLLVQRKVTKRNDAPEPPTASCASRENRRSPNSPGAEQRASGSNTRLAPPDFPCDARRRLRVLKTPWSSRAPREAEAPARRGERGIASVRIRDRDVAYAHPLRQTRGEGTGEAGADQGACFLLVSFLCTSKEKKPWVRGGSIPLLFFQSCALRTHKQSSVGQLPTSKCRRKRLD